MQVSKQDQVRPQKAVFRAFGFLHLDDHVGLSPDVFGGQNDGGAGGPVFVVGNRTAFAGKRLHKDPVTGLPQCCYSTRHYANTCLVVLNFFRHSDCHTSIVTPKARGGG